MVEDVLKSAVDYQALDDVKHDIKIDIRNCAIETVQKYHIKTMRDTDDIMLYDNDYYFEGSKELRSLFDSKFKNNATIGNQSLFLNFIRANSTIKRESFLESENKINLNNCVIDVMTGEVLKHSPNYNFLYKLNIDYNKDAKCPSIEKFLRSVVNTESDYRCIVEVMGYTLTSGYKFHNLLVLLGTGGHNGKSTYIKLIKKLLNSNVSDVSMQDLSNDRFASADLYGKKANLCADLPKTTINDTGVLKQLTGEDTLRAQEKGKKAFAFFNSAKMIFSCNDLPEIKDKTRAMWYRIILINFPNEFRGSKENKNLFNEITTPGELSGLINICIESIKRLFSNNSFSYNHETTMDRWDEYREESNPNPIDTFWKEGVETDKNSWASKDLLYKSYELWCDLRQVIPVSNSKFSRCVNMYLHQEEDFRPMDDSGRQVYAWKGIKVRDPYLIRAIGKNLYK